MDAHLTADIAVVLPAYNAAAHLHEAIESIVQQSFARWEMVIVNDGSTDSTAEVANDWTAKDARIRCIHLEKNAGLVNALNTGIAHTTAPFIARMDADDVSVAQRFQRQYDFLQSHPNVGICGGAIQWMHHHRIIAAPQTHDQIVMRAFSESPFAHPTVMMRRSVLVENALAYSAETFPAEDYDLWSRMLRFTQGHNLQEVVLHYRVHEAQISSQGNTRQLEAALRVLRSNVAYALGRTLSDAESLLCNDILRSVSRVYTAQELALTGALLEELHQAVSQRLQINVDVVLQACRNWWWNVAANTVFQTTAEVMRERRRSKPTWQRMGMRYYVHQLKRALKQ